mmetsp:Transcript_66412/g.138702  ORF Transcript_66412/g.138702 Transcript_66412/m.138702 type:complete len:89 (-) Transcript_66412:256-522(-)
MLLPPLGLGPAGVGSVVGTMGTATVAVAVAVHGTGMDIADGAACAAHRAAGIGNSQNPFGTCLCWYWGFEACEAREATEPEFPKKAGT